MTLEYTAEHAEGSRGQAVHWANNKEVSPSLGLAFGGVALGRQPTAAIPGMDYNGPLGPQPI